MNCENVFDLRKIEDWYTKELLLSIYEGLKSGESITLLGAENLDWINKEITGANVKSDKKDNNLWSVTLVKSGKKECCGMCGGH